jgi:hypothetical protein
MGQSSSVKEPNGGERKHWTYGNAVPAAGGVQLGHQVDKVSNRYNWASPVIGE